MMVPLIPDKTYHIYNRANGNENIFMDEGNYQFFMKKYRSHVTPIADTYCYCLMPNHFHFLVKIKGADELMRLLSFPKFHTLEKIHENETSEYVDVLEKIISKRFPNLFSSYSQAFNKQQGRKGSLFMKNFKRKQVNNEKYLKKLVHYIHYNPITCGLVETPEKWKFSSYNSVLSAKKSLLLKDEVLKWFENRENFIYCHRFPPKETGIETF